MSTIIITVGGRDEEWGYTSNRACPECGEAGIYTSESDSSQYDSIGLCVACDSTWVIGLHDREWTRARALRIREWMRNRDKGTWSA